MSQGRDVEISHLGTGRLRVKGEEGSGDLESAGVSQLNKGKGSQRSQRQRLAHLLAQVSLAQAGASGTGLEEPSGPGLVRGVTRECLLRGRVCGSGGNMVPSRVCVRRQTGPSISVCQQMSRKPGISSRASLFSTEKGDHYSPLGRVSNKGRRSRPPRARPALCALLTTPWARAFTSSVQVTDGRLARAQE